MTATLTDRLVKAFKHEGVLYSHWKSNIDLARATAGEIDLDLLVDRRSVPAALAILSELGFKTARARWADNPPGIRHYYGLDPDSNRLIHVHLFSRVLTGESYVKSHLLPFAEMLLENAYYVGHVRVASKSAELLLFTVRTFIKYGSLPDLLNLWKKSTSLKEELYWLQTGGDRSETLSFLEQYCPVIDEQLFRECVDTLGGDTPLLGRIILARRVRRRLRVYARHGSLQRLLAYSRVLGSAVRRQLGSKREKKVLGAGGSVIAFIGADATGKSTLVSETGQWLGKVFTVKTIHTGKPPSSWVTAPINLPLALARRLRLLGDTQPTEKQKPAAGKSRPAGHRFGGLSSLLYELRSAALAWDRRRLVLNARRQAAEGEIVICDRYPSLIVGAMDSPRLQQETSKTGPAVAIYNFLARLEKRLYRQIPPPDIVLRLNVSVETAKRRNRERNGQDGEAYLEARHRQSRQWHLPGTGEVHDIDTDRTLEETMSQVKQAIWESL